MREKISNLLEILREAYQDVWWALWRFRRNLVWGIIHRVHPKYRYHVVKTGLKPGYYDPDTRILYTNMNLTKEFVDITKDTVEWNSDEGHRHAWDELQTIYKWWEGYEDLLKSRDKTLDNPNFEGYAEFEQRVYDEEKEMLVRLMKVRNFMWYP